MLLNSETDYAIRILSCLSEQDARIGAVEISEKTGVSQRFALKILHKLVLAGLVGSVRGSKGGYRLAKPAGSITLLDDFETMNGPLSLNRCQLAGETCTHPEGYCRYRAVFADITCYIKKKLSEITLDQNPQNFKL